MKVKFVDENRIEREIEVSGVRHGSGYVILFVEVEGVEFSKKISIDDMIYY